MMRDSPVQGMYDIVHTEWGDGLCDGGNDGRPRGGPGAGGRVALGARLRVVTVPGTVAALHATCTLFTASPLILSKFLNLFDRSQTWVTTSTATKQDTESCGQPKGHKPTGELGVSAARAGAAGGWAAPLARRGTPPTSPVTPPPPPPPPRRRLRSSRAPTPKAQ
ncbi:hypothetical protein K1T71_002455 [Dendrolimus kikuchii]|uniref:Uncharacterized protein n=1 Tax=Dendrolimus kikuchii TaxID=765133 RepID=A0ACC1DCR3_9NEOP|nr:hypothetical protein K1T71_002455 [Dendrolimus kikuchii]